MATSSRGRSTLGQWQRLVSVLREYLQARGTKVNHVLSSTATGGQSQQAAAAMQALELYLQEARTGQLPINANKQPNTTDVGQAIDKKLDDLHGLPEDPGTTKINNLSTHARQSCNIVNDDTTSVNIGIESCSSSAPTLRATSTVPSSPFSMLKRSASPNNIGASKTVINGGRLTVPSPTYSTMRISVDSNKNGTCRKPDHTDQAATMPTPESDIKKAFRTVNSYIPTSLSEVTNLSFLRNTTTNEAENKKEKKVLEWVYKKRDVISKASIDSRTRHLVRGVTMGSGEGLVLRRLEDLSAHLRTYPDTKAAAVKCGGLGRLLWVLKETRDEHVKQEARVVLGLMGYAGAVGGRGPRVLAIDGGGVRGLVAIELLRKLEEETGRPIHELFDFICGVSTGAIVAVLVGAHCLPLSQCEDLYRDLSERIFSQTTFKGATGLVINNSYYDSRAWDEILQENMGDAPLLDVAAQEGAPKLCMVASHAARSLTSAFLFRNYVLPYRVASHYNGTSHAKMWQAVRASAAAPGYFSEFPFNDMVLLDGGILVNNPAAIAVHEARQLWPDLPFQCVVSLGTGRCQPMEGAQQGMGADWGGKIRSMINSATDTEGVHTVLHDLLPTNVYFRFNPHLSDEFTLDEIKRDRLAAMMEDTKLYARQNAAKFEQAALALNQDKTPYHKARDAFKKGQLLYGWNIEG